MAVVAQQQIATSRGPIPLCHSGVAERLWDHYFSESDKFSKKSCEIWQQLGKSLMRGLFATLTS
ncbi:hypothetical protein Enr13x_28160 [Stieleria neptunia]|uniref:Uncharacterized protein n=1 Tax=Stieleria neptunia TaxID=2527979 RepID=A0A518HQ43_9BACT|nr:hypothetical protein Enr13x_28160 [Stieleria neptunia]